MNRALELTAKLVDGDLDAAEEDELRALLAADAAAKAAHLSMLRLERTLRSMHDPQDGAPAKVDRARAVLDRLAALEEKRVQNVLAAIRRPPAPRRRRLSVVWMAAAAAVVLVGAVALLRGRRERSPVVASSESRDRDPAAGAAAPRLAAGERGSERAGRPPANPSTGAFRIDGHRGAGTVTRGGRRLALSGASDLQTGDAVHLPGGTALALSLSDARFDFDSSQEMQFRLEGEAAGRSTLHLERGAVRVQVKDERDASTVVTPHARVELLAADAHLAVYPARPGYEAMTRLQVKKGRARVMPARRQSTDLEAGQLALVRDEGDVVVRAVAPDLIARIPLVPDPDPSGTVLMSFDFEGGAVPAGWTTGDLAPDPDPRGAGHCLAGAAYPHTPRNKRTLRLSHAGRTPDPGLVAHSPQLVLRFWYWAGAGVEALEISVKDRQRQLYYHASSDLVRERWTQATVRLADLKAGKGVSQRAVPDGIPLMHLTIVGGEVGGPLVCVDDLELVQYPLDARPPTSFTAARR